MGLGTKIGGAGEGRQEKSLSKQVSFRVFSLEPLSQLAG